MFKAIFKKVFKWHLGIANRGNHSQVLLGYRGELSICPNYDPSFLTFQSPKSTTISSFLFASKRIYFVILYDFLRLFQTSKIAKCEKYFNCFSQQFFKNLRNSQIEMHKKVMRKNLKNHEKYSLREAKKISKAVFCKRQRLENMARISEKYHLPCR